MSMSLSYALECSVCLQFITAEKRGETASMAALVGAAAYAVCPCCRQEVEDHTDPDYREAARQWVMEQTVAELIKLNPQLFKKKGRCMTQYKMFEACKEDDCGDCPAEKCEGDEVVFCGCECHQDIPFDDPIPERGTEYA